MSKGRFISLKLSMGAAFAITVIATSAFIGISSFYAARAFIRESIRLRLQDIATLAAMPLDAKDIAKIHTREDETRPEYLKLKNYLEQVRRINPEIQFTYLYRVHDNGKVYAVVENEPIGSPDMSHAGDPYPDATPLARAVYRPDAKAESEKDFWTDQWGVYLSSYIPILNESGKVECGLGIDMSAKAVREYERRFLIKLAGLALAITMIVLIASLWYARRISKPLLSLSEELGHVERLELDHQIEIRSAVREVAMMRDAVQKMKNSLRSFRKYVPADLVSDLMALGQEARLSAERREITVFFSDIANFSNISESMQSEHLERLVVENLSVYFDGMTRLIIESNGTVDKYIGDAIMAFWGAPHELADHAVQACLAAIKCRDCSTRIAEEEIKAGRAPMYTRIGLHTGEAIIGNIGYDERLNYTAMGDTVNLSSRLEGLNKYFGTQILISEQTRQLACEVIETRFIGVVTVSGRSIPVRVYELICKRGEISQSQKDFVSKYEQGMELYLGRKFTEAAALFEKLSAAHPSDLATSLMPDRCHQLIANPPPAEWQGEFVMKSK